jgi:hypothetical protein
MADKVVWSLNVEIPGGPKLVLPPQSVSLESYGKTVVTVPGEDPKKAGDPGKVAVALLPAGATALFLLITASEYSKVSYKPKGAAKEIVLDSPQVFTGAGSLALAGDLTSVEFINAAGKGKDTVVTIIAGYDATP